MPELACLGELRRQLEQLDPRLQPFLRSDGVLHHPLVIDPRVNPERAALVNSNYARKLKILDKAFSEANWHNYVFAHERPYRLEGFTWIVEELGDAEYWELLSIVWDDSENIHQNIRLWRAYWSSYRSMKDHAMNDDERKLLSELPDVIEVYRGQDRRRCTGVSWSLDRERAIWFANRYDSRQPWLLTGKVKKADVHAYLDRRDEREIVASKVRVNAREIVIKPNQAREINAQKAT